MSKINKYPGAFIAAFFELGRIIKNLNFENYSTNFKRNLARRGLRNGDSSRNIAETIKIFETIPTPIRAQGEEAVRKYLSGLDWSHIKSYHNGGGNGASNGIFEDFRINRSRGGKNMNLRDRFIAYWKSFEAALPALVKQISSATVKGAVIEAGIEFIFATWKNSLLYIQGQITLPELIDRIKDQTLEAAIAGAVGTGLLVTACLIFPPIGIILEALTVFFAVQGIVSMVARIWNLLWETGKTLGFTKQVLAI